MLQESLRICRTTVPLPTSVQCSVDLKVIRGEPWGAIIVHAAAAMSLSFGIPPVKCDRRGILPWNRGFRLQNQHFSKRDTGHRPLSHGRDLDGISGSNRILFPWQNV